MNAYSQDLRQRIIKAVELTGNQTQVAITFQVSRSTVRQLLKLEKVDPTLAAKPRPGGQTEIAPENYPAVIALLQEHNDLTLTQLCQLWQEQYHQLVSVATMSRLLKRLGWTRKKESGRHRAKSTSPRRVQIPASRLEGRPTGGAG